MNLTKNSLTRKGLRNMDRNKRTCFLYSSKNGCPHLLTNDNLSLLLLLNCLFIILSSRVTYPISSCIPRNTHRGSHGENSEILGFRRTLGWGNFHNRNKLLNFNNRNKLLISGNIHEHPGPSQSDMNQTVTSTTDSKSGE